MEIMHNSTKRIEEYPDLRTGQAFFNELHTVYPEIANMIRGTELDPFYRSELLPELYEFLLVGTEPLKVEQDVWQACPLCKDKDDSKSINCRACKGKGIISIKTGKPPE